MPIVYSFFTSGMPEEVWPCLDVDPGSFPFFLTADGVSYSRGTPWLRLNGSNELLMTSDDGIETLLEVALPISSSFTFETTFTPEALPVNFEDLAESRFFIGMFNAQGNAGGVLISRVGLALVSTFGNAVSSIAGSQNILPQSNDVYVLRILVDGTNNLMDIYITPQSQLAYTGHILRYTAAAPATPETQPDSLRIEMMGSANVPTRALFNELKFNCTSLLIPNKRPVAVIDRDRTENIGTLVQFDGSGSYDPEREPLGYTWSLILCPSASKYVSTGTNGYTVDDGDMDGYTTLFKASGSPWSAINAPSLQPGDVLVVEGVQHIVTEEDWVWNSALGMFERDISFDPDVLKTQMDSIPDALSGVVWKLYHQSAFFDDRTAPNPQCVPDTPGLYQVQLIVNDGYLDSLADVAIMNITESHVTFGCIPDVNFIWDFLSDAWSLLGDRDPITTIWSSLAQVLSNVAMAAWQHDYGKSLIDIQRTFQRRWLHYDPFHEEPSADRSAVSLQFVRGPICSIALANPTVFASNTVLMALDAAEPTTVTLDGSLTPQDIADAVNNALGLAQRVDKVASVQSVGVDDYLVLSWDGLIRIEKTGTANATLGYSTAQVTTNRLFGYDGESDPDDIDQFRTFQANDPLTDVRIADYTMGLLIFNDVGYGITSASSAKRLKAVQDLEPLTMAGWEISSALKAQNTDFTALKVQAGDMALFDVTTTGSDSPTRVVCEITGARGQLLGFDPTPLYEASQGYPEAVDIEFLGVKRLHAMTINSLVKSIPRLQEIIVDPDESDLLHQGLDYTLQTDTDGAVSIVFSPDTWTFDNPPPDKLWAELTFLDNSGAIEDTFGKAVGFTKEKLDARSDNLDYLSAVRGLWYSFFGGPTFYRVRTGIQILLGLPFAEVKGTIEEINRTYSTEFIRVLIQDYLNPTLRRAYYIPRNLVWEGDGETTLASNPATGETYAAGDIVEQFAPLSTGVDVVDYVKDPRWWEAYFQQLGKSEVEKFSYHLLKADIDMFDINNLVFALEFTRSIKPGITYPLWVIDKRLPPDEINVTDVTRREGTLYLYDDPEAQGVSGTGGSYRFDDTDESGNYNFGVDGPKPLVAADRRRLFPEDEVTITIIP